MNRTTLLIFFLLSTIVAHAQSNALLLQKRGRTQKSYLAGHYISLQTKQGNYADGIITRIQSDTIYIRHFDVQQTATSYGGVYFDTAFRYTTAIHYRDIGGIMKPAYDMDKAKRYGNLLMIAGGGVMALGAINGLYRGEPPKDWYNPSGYIVSGTLIGLGLLLKKGRKPAIPIRKKYSLKILQLENR
jgi:hypothetical protein